MEITTKHTPSKPQGSPFIVTKSDFHYGEQVDFSLMDLDEDKILNWPMVYILANDEYAYVGQTNSVQSRMDQHRANVEKKDFTTCNIIFNEEFNTSVITDYENKLIDLMHGDQKYTLTNKNDGMSNLNYFSKEVYDQMFKDLWEKLRQLDLTNHTIDEIEQSEVFKYSPFKSLTADQRVALDTIMDSIEKGLDKAEPICVQGMPGTGKTILAIYLIKMLRDNPKYKDKKIGLIEPVTSLRNTLKASLRGVSNIKPRDIIGPSEVAHLKNGYDILLVDEAHKLKRRKNLGAAFGSFDQTCEKLGLDKYNDTQLDWILKQAKLPILFYDPKQSIGPNCVTRAQFNDKMGPYLKNSIILDTQMRVKGGEDYLRLIEDMLNCRVSGNYDIKDYDFKIHDTFEDFCNSFEEKYSKHSLSRMTAGYAWPWISKKDSSKCDIVIDGIGRKWNCTNDNWVGKGFNNEDIAHEVGCIHSIQGYDLSYSYVIIGNDIYYDPKTNQIKANKTSYFDTNGKNTATQEDLDQYIKNIYYVLLTRGIKGTYVYICNENLKKYARRFFYEI